jgi:hypothetical protein
VSAGPDTFPAACVCQARILERREGGLGLDSCQGLVYPSGEGADLTCVGLWRRTARLRGPSASPARRQQVRKGGRSVSTGYLKRGARAEVPLAR